MCAVGGEQAAEVAGGGGKTGGGREGEEECRTAVSATAGATDSLSGAQSQLAMHYRIPQRTGKSSHVCLLQPSLSSSSLSQISSLQTEHRVAVSGLERQLRESLQQCSELQAKTQQQLITLDTQQAELASATREKENMETALTALREEVSIYWEGVWSSPPLPPTFPPAVCSRVQSSR